jgi:predicted CopG family antitoxin
MKTKRLISFSEAAYEWLKAEAERFDLSVSEFVRRLVDEKRKRSVKK